MYIQKVHCIHIFFILYYYNSAVYVSSLLRGMKWAAVTEGARLKRFNSFIWVICVTGLSAVFASSRTKGECLHSQLFAWQHVWDTRSACRKPWHHCPCIPPLSKLYWIDVERPAEVLHHCSTRPSHHLALTLFWGGINTAFFSKRDTERHFCIFTSF